MTDPVPPIEVLRARKVMNDAIRRFFDQRGFLEVDTPIAVPSPGMEPHLVAFETTRTGPGGDRHPLYLHTSPEYAMKRMLARGIAPIYQLARVFRDGELSRTHTPEFTMLEWYRAPGTLDELMDDVEALATAVADDVDGSWRPSKFERVSVSEAFERAGLQDPLPIDDCDGLRRALAVRHVDGDTWDDIYHRAFFESVEPTFASDTVTMLYGYPARMAALARIDPAHPQACLRFEVFVGALELGNAFDELTDPVEQRRRFVEDTEVRCASGRATYPIDEDLLAELDRIGPAAGIALGVDRLLMLCLGAKAINDVIPFAPV